jgi:hypothetical protein
MILPLGNRICARVELNNELDVPIWWHPRQIIWKDFGILTDYRNVF